MKRLTLLLVATCVTLALYAQRPFAERQKASEPDAPMREPIADINADDFSVLMHYFKPLRTPYAVTEQAFNPLIKHHLEALDLSFYPVIPAMSKYLTDPSRVQFWAVGYRKTEQGHLALVYALQYAGSAVPTEYWLQALAPVKEGFRRMGKPVQLARYIDEQVVQSGILDAKFHIQQQWHMKHAPNHAPAITHEAQWRLGAQGWEVTVPRHAVTNAYYRPVAPAVRSQGTTAVPDDQ